MKVIFLHSRSQITLDTLTNGNLYEVIDYSVFGNRNPEYKIINDFGNEIWVNSEFFINLQENRDYLIDKIIYSNLD